MYCNQYQKKQLIHDYVHDLMQMNLNAYFLYLIKMENN